MDSIANTALALLSGFAVTVLGYLTYHGLENLILPPLWASATLVLLLSTAAVSFEPFITGNIIADSLTCGALAYFTGLVLFSGIKPLLYNPPDPTNFLLYLLFLSLLIRGYLWAGEEVESGS